MEAAAAPAVPGAAVAASRWMEVWESIKSAPEQPNAEPTERLRAHNVFSQARVLNADRKGPKEKAWVDPAVPKATTFWREARPERAQARSEEREAKRQKKERKEKRKKRPNKKNRRKKRLPRNQRRAKRRVARSRGHHRGRFCRPKQLKRQQRRYEKRAQSHLHAQSETEHQWVDPQPSVQPEWHNDPNKLQRRQKKEYAIGRTATEFQQDLVSFEREAQPDVPGGNVLDAVVTVKPDLEDDDPNRTKSGRFRQRSKESTGSRINWSVKMKLKSALFAGKDPSAITEQQHERMNRITEGLKNLAHKMHQPTIEASRIALLYVLQILKQEDKALPALDLDFWKKIYEAARSGVGYSPGEEWNKLPGFVDFFRDVYVKMREECGLMGFSEEEYTSQISQHLAKQFMHNCQLHVIDLLQVIVGRYAFLWIGNMMDSDSPHWQCLAEHEDCYNLRKRITSFFVRKLCYSTNHQDEQAILAEISADIGTVSGVDGTIYVASSILEDVLEHIKALMNRYYTTSDKDNHTKRDYVFHRKGSPHVNHYWKYIPLIHDLQDALDNHVDDPKQIKILPQSSLEVKDIRINSSTIHEVRFHVDGVRPGQGAMPKDEYKALLYEYFPKARQYEQAEDSGNREFLGCTTDGMSISLQFGPHEKRGGQEEENNEVGNGGGNQQPPQEEEKEAGGDEQPPQQEEEKEEAGSVGGDEQPPQQQGEEPEAGGNEQPPPAGANPPTETDASGFSYTRREAISDDYIHIFCDPGEREILNCATKNGAKTWRLTERHLQHVRGTKMLAAKAEQMMEKFKTDSGVDLKAIPSGKTIKVEVLREHIQFVLTNMQSIKTFYQQGRPKNQKFTRYVKLQETLHAMYDCLYNHGDLDQTSNSKKVIVFGKANFYGSKGRKRGRGRIMAPFKKFKNYLLSLHAGPEDQGGLHFLDEHGTSKYCCNCHEELADVKKEVENKDTEQKIHALKVCEHEECFQNMLNRDTNAVMNFQYLYFRVIVFGLRREAPFARGYCLPCDDDD